MSRNVLSIGISANTHLSLAIIDENTTDRLIVKGVIESQWPEANVTEFAKPSTFINMPLRKNFDFTSEKKMHVPCGQNSSLEKKMHGPC